MIVSLAKNIGVARFFSFVSGELNYAICIVLFARKVSLEIEDELFDFNVTTASHNLVILLQMFVKTLNQVQFNCFHWKLIKFEGGVDRKSCFGKIWICNEINEFSIKNPKNWCSSLLQNIFVFHTGNIFFVLPWKFVNL